METVSNPTEATSAIKELAKAVSTQVRLANRAWYVAMAVALIVLFPPKGAGNPLGDVTLPFGFGVVNGKDFYPVVFALYSILILAFASAHAQVTRANKLAHQALGKMSSSALLGIHVMDLYDMFMQASVNRVAPLAQIIRGKYQFHDNAMNCPVCLRIGTAIYYLILKIIAFFVYWMLPWYAFWLAFSKANEASLSTLWSYPILVIGSSSLLVVAISDINYVFTVTKILFRSPINKTAS